MSTTVKIVHHGGEDNHWAIEVTTPGWRGIDAAFEGPIKWPDDLKQIHAVLKESKAKIWKRLLMNDGTTEFVLEDGADLELAVVALVRAGWLTPEASHDAGIQ